MEPLPDGVFERVRHFRFYQGGLMPESSLRQLGVMSQVEPRGGRTTVELYVMEGGVDRVVATGSVACNPKETYSKRMGRMIARGRALAYLDGRARARNERRDRREREKIEALVRLT